MEGLTHALGKPRGGACFRVQVDDGDELTRKYTNQEDLHKAIWDNIYRKRFFLAELPHCANNHFAGPLVTTPSAKLHKISLMGYTIHKILTTLPGKSFRSVH